MASDRVPTEFRYFENFATAPVQRRRAAARTLLGFDPVLPDETVPSTQWRPGAPAAGSGPDSESGRRSTARWSRSRAEAR